MLTVLYLLDLMRPFTRLVYAVLHVETSQLNMFPLSNSIRIVHMAQMLRDVSKSCYVNAEAVRVAFEFFSQRAALGFAIPEWLPTPDNLQYHAAVSQLDSAVYGIIEDRKQQLSALHASLQHSQVGNSSCNGPPLELSALRCA